MTTTYADRLRNALSVQHRQWFDYDKKCIKSEFAEHIPCPACGSQHFSPYMEKDYFAFSRCDDCTMVFLNPRLNVEATYAFYNGEWTAIYNETKFIGASESTEVDNRINYRNIDLLRRHLISSEKQHKLLEIGIGSGYFLRAAENAGFDVHGIDVDSCNIARARQHFGDRVRNQDIYEAQYHEATFDVVYMRDVFEHVPNPSPMLREINRISRPGALIYIEVPNIQGLIYSAVGARHVCVFGFAHLNYWSPAALRTVLNRNGYEVVDIVHESLDCTVAEVVRYYRISSFTSVFPQPIGRIRYLLLTAAYAFLRLPPLVWLDRTLFPTLANILNRGSVLKVVARKVAQS
jgi:2-polyprenyl-3-methyl-5-hydroxy-6-metoxy-1,4-benzoquinol methylase